jgi:hypothetical protein
MHVLIGILAKKQIDDIFNKNTKRTIFSLSNELLSVKALTVRWRLQVYSKLLPFWQQLLQFKPLLLPQMLV